MMAQAIFGQAFSLEQLVEATARSSYPIGSIMENHSELEGSPTDKADSLKATRAFLAMRMDNPPRHESELAAILCANRQPNDARPSMEPVTDNIALVKSSKRTKKRPKNVHAPQYRCVRLGLGMKVSFCSTQMPHLYVQ